MGNFLLTIGHGIEQCDLFAAPVLLRYKTQEDKKSKIGGCTSIALIILLVAAFSNQWIGLFRKSDIQANQVTIREMDPSPVVINSQTFVVAIGFDAIDTSLAQKYVDLVFTYETMKNGILTEVLKINMIPCQPRHFSHFGSDIQNFYYKMRLNNCLCWPDDFSVNITGKYSSDVFTYIHVTVQKCTSNCANQSEIENIMNTYGALNLNYYFINKLVNPTLIEPVSYYLEDKNYEFINNQLATVTNLYLGEYQIQTDESLWPVEDIQTISGIFVDRTEKQVMIHSVENGIYSDFHFRKSDQKIQIQRSFRKIDDLFSYIGGLFGILASVFGLVITHYNKCCYELQMSNKIFKSQEQDGKKENINEIREAIHCNKGTLDPKQNANLKDEDIGFNFLTYLKYMFAKIIFTVCPNFNWVKMKNIQDRMEETENQMNVDIILQKISYYERAFQCLFDSNQITLLMLQEKVSISQLKEQRAIMNIQDQSFMNQATGKNQGNKIFNIYNPNPTQFDINSKSNANEEGTNEMIIQIFQAIEDTTKKSGSNEVCKKILLGLRQDLKQKYKQHLKKFKGKVYQRRSSNFSKFLISHKKIQDIPYNVHNLEIPMNLGLKKNDIFYLSQSSSSSISRIELALSHRDKDGEK